MGLTIILEDENGQPIRTLPSEFDYDVLDKIDLDDYFLLKYVDSYGDTTFNTLQLDDLESDFKKLITVVPTQRDSIELILDLIKESQNEVHTYIKFYGD